MHWMSLILLFSQSALAAEVEVNFSLGRSAEVLDSLQSVRTVDPAVEFRLNNLIIRPWMSFPTVSKIHKAGIDRIKKAGYFDLPFPEDYRAGLGLGYGHAVSLSAYELRVNAWAGSEVKHTYMISVDDDYVSTPSVVGGSGAINVELLRGRFGLRLEARDAVYFQKFFGQRGTFNELWLGANLLVRLG